jgi:hypothetical protein
MTEAPPASSSGILWAVLPTGLVVGLVFVWGGYAAGWAWTGLSGDVKLWDWLEALALPVTVGLVPLLLHHRQRLHRRHHTAAAAILAGFGALVLAGYLVPMRWTGFTGNTLWDWLSLALLPVVIATSTLWREPRRWTARHRAVVGCGAAIGALVVIAGYTIPWDWTGFRDNTAWDWIKLMLLPVLLPTLVLPRLVDAADDWMSRQATADAPDVVP